MARPLGTAGLTAPCRRTRPPEIRRGRSPTRSALRTSTIGLEATIVVRVVTRRRAIAHSGPTVKENEPLLAARLVADEVVRPDEGEVLALQRDRRAAHALAADAAR